MEGGKWKKGTRRMAKMPRGRQNNYFACCRRLRLAEATMAPSDDPFPPPQKLVLKPAEFERDNEPAASGEPASNDPMEMLKVNRAHEVEIGYGNFELKPKKKFTRRIKEYLLALCGVNLFLGMVLHASGDPVSMVFIIAAMAFFSGGLTWVMLFVIEDY